MGRYSDNDIKNLEEIRTFLDEHDISFSTEIGRAHV